MGGRMIEFLTLLLLVIILPSAMGGMLLDKKDLLDNHLEYTATHHQLKHDSDILHTNFDENGDGQISELELSSLFLKGEERKRSELDGADWREIPYTRTEVGILTPFESVLPH
jgi:hypothetical protein